MATKLDIPVLINPSDLNMVLHDLLLQLQINHAYLQVLVNLNDLTGGGI